MAESPAGEGQLLLAMPALAAQAEMAVREPADVAGVDSARWQMLVALAAPRPL